jgi:hypothetical protein
MVLGVDLNFVQVDLNFDLLDVAKHRPTAIMATNAKAAIPRGGPKEMPSQT